ncbi:MAG TPA: alpha/beta hydrolase-fold protein [Daejeonella sp.]|nr:alpha/beta hydrolase-fold protein [Daejeonella sp.]
MPAKNFLYLLLILAVSSYKQVSAQSRKVTFIVRNQASFPSDSKLFLAGSMNNWNPADPGYIFRQNAEKGYELTVNLPDGINEYKITRGSWETVETRSDGQPVSNRSLVSKKDTVIYLDIQQWQDSFKPQPKTHTASRNVRVIDTAFKIPQLDRVRRIWVYLPPDYQSSGKKYPVIYMHDGQNLFDAYTAGYGEWGVDELMDSLYLKNNKMAIIVGIDHGDQHRLTEYNPFDNERFGKGRGDDYVDFIVQTLKPFIDKTYQTKSSARHTTIAGSSMGGLISMYAMAKYPQVFGKAGVFSPAFWIAPAIYAYLADKKLPKHKIYFVAGDMESNEMVPDMKKLHGQLLSQGVKSKQMQLKAAADGKHSEWFWHREFPAFYNWIMK